MSGEIIEPAPKAPPPPPTVSVGEILAIGSLKVHLIKGVAFAVDYEAARKVTKKVADGDDDATTVDGGREVRTITVKMSWKDTAEANKLAKPILLGLDPSRKDTGNPPAWAHERNGLDLAALKNVRNVVVEKAKGPNCAPGSGVNIYELTLSSQSKSTKGTAKTEQGSGFVLGSESAYDKRSAETKAAMKKAGVPMIGDKPKVKP